MGCTYEVLLPVLLHLPQSLLPFQSLCSAASYPADIVLALCGDRLKDNFLAANTQENLLNFVQEFLWKRMQVVFRNNQKQFYHQMI